MKSLICVEQDSVCKSSRDVNPLNVLDITCSWSLKDSMIIRKIWMQTNMLAGRQSERYTKARDKVKLFYVSLHRWSFDMIEDR